MPIKKDWYQIFTPQMFGKKAIAETLCSDSDHIKGRTIHVGLTELVSNISKFYMIMHFKVIEVDGHNAFTEFVGHDIMHDQLYRMVSKGRSRVDNIEDITTKDEKKMRIKVLTILYRRTKTSIKSATRKDISKKLREFLKDKTTEDIINFIISGELQKKLKEKMKKIYPVQTVEIRKSEIISNNK